MGIREQIIALYEDRPKTDRDLVRDYADVIADALSHKVTISKIFVVMQDAGFKGTRQKFTRILQEQGLYTIRKQQRQNRDLNV